MNDAAHNSYDPRLHQEAGIVHRYSGFENKVKESLEQRVNAYGLQAEIGRSPS